MSYSASQGDPWALAQLRQRAQQQQDTREEAVWSRRHQLERTEALDDEKRKQNAPRYFSGGTDQLSFDPSTGKVSTLYDAPTAAEQYAKGLGYEPGTPEYRSALTDATLKAYGPTAADVRGDLIDRRFQGSAGLEAIRQGNRMALRGSPTYAQKHTRGNGYGHSGGSIGKPTPTTVFGGILAKQASGQPLTPAEKSTLGMYHPGGGGRGHGAAVQTATDPKTGRKVAWNGSAWVPAN